MSTEKFLNLEKASTRKQYKRLVPGFHHKQKRLNKGISHKDTRATVQFA